MKNIFFFCIFAFTFLFFYQIAKKYDLRNKSHKNQIEVLVSPNILNVETTTYETVNGY
jgi:hypothetical protein